MENYEKFLSRVNEFETPDFRIDQHSFKPSNSVLQKIDAENHFCKFYGDTIIFDLDLSTQEKINALIDVLYEKAPECFAERLPRESLHLTLHDLSSASSLDEISEQMDKNMRVVEANQLAFVTSRSNIRMRTNNIINMVNTSVVLCAVPVDEFNYMPLMTYYTLADQTMPLPYPFTPHITLAYYNCHGFNQESAQKLTEAVNLLNNQSFEFRLKGSNLFYCRFRNMTNFVRYLRLS